MTHLLHINIGDENDIQVTGLSAGIISSQFENEAEINYPNTSYRCTLRSSDAPSRIAASARSEGSIPKRSTAVECHNVSPQSIPDQVLYFAGRGSRMHVNANVCCGEIALELRTSRPTSYAEGKT